jgi:hypothetical protein
MATAPAKDCRTPLLADRLRQKGSLSYGALAAHKLLLTEKARRLLGYRPAYGWRKAAKPCLRAPRSGPAVWSSIPSTAGAVRPPIKLSSWVPFDLT